MGLKFLRNGMDSANLVAMYSVNGQPDEWNFFANDFTNHIQSASGVALKLVAAKFATETSYIQEVGLSDWGMYDQDGNKEENPVFPFKLRLEPHADVKDLISSDKPDDYMAFVDQLKTQVPANATLY